MVSFADNQNYCIANQNTNSKQMNNHARGAQPPPKTSDKQTDGNHYYCNDKDTTGAQGQEYYNQESTRRGTSVRVC